MPLRFRPNVLAMRPYSPGRPIEEVQRELGLDDVIKLASNENPLGPSPLAVAAIREAADKLHLYPDAATFELRQALGAHTGFPADQIVPGNGSDELLTLLGLILLGSEADEVVVGDPSFVRYDATAQLAPCKLIRVPLNSQMEMDLEAMAAAVNSNTRIIFLANPNNPTGTIFRKAAFETFLASIPDHVCVVMDEAYFEFAAHVPDYPNGLDFVHRYPNVVVLRTLSKAYGLAGVRVGYMVSSLEIADAVNRVRPPFDVNTLAQVGAVAGLKDEEYRRRSVEHNQKAIQRLSAALQQQGAKVFESYANFVLADMGEPAEPLFQALLRKGVIVRSGHVLGLPTCLRVSVGTDEEIERFVAALEAVMKEKATV